MSNPEDLHALILRSEQERLEQNALINTQRQKEYMADVTFQVCMLQYNYLILSMAYAALNPNLFKPEEKA